MNPALIVYLLGITIVSVCMPVLLAIALKTQDDHDRARRFKRGAVLVLVVGVMMTISATMNALEAGNTTRGIAMMAGFFVALGIGIAISVAFPQTRLPSPGVDTASPRPIDVTLYPSAKGLRIPQRASAWILPGFIDAWALVVLLAAGELWELGNVEAFSVAMAVAVLMIGGALLSASVTSVLNPWPFRVSLAAFILLSAGLAIALATGSMDSPPEVIFAAIMWPIFLVASLFARFYFRKIGLVIRLIPRRDSD